MWPNISIKLTCLRRAAYVRRKRRIFKVSGCFLQGFGACRGGLSREHYISESVLRATGANPAAKIGGLAWQPADTIQSIGIGSLQSKILCEGHNSNLSPIDAVAANLFKTLHAIDKDRPSVPSLSTFDGPGFERWLLKVLFGISASGGFQIKAPPDNWKAILMGAPWPESRGMYVFPPDGSEMFSSDLYIETKLNPATKEILAASFRFAGITFNLLFGKPDHPLAFGIHRPRGLIFQHDSEERRVEFLWPFQTEIAIAYKCVGTTTSKPSYYGGWKEQ